MKWLSTTSIITCLLALAAAVANVAAVSMRAAAVATGRDSGLGESYDAPATPVLDQSSDNPPCNCDCCFTQQSLPGETNYPWSKCAAPQKIDFVTSEGAAVSDKCYSAFCALGSSPFDSQSNLNVQNADGSESENPSAQENGQYDFSRYCFESCLPAAGSKATVKTRGAENGGFCQEKSIVLTRESKQDWVVWERQKKQKLLLKKMELAKGRHDPPLWVVEGMMLEAKENAIRWGKAAMRAKMNYERLLGSVHHNAEKVGKTTLDEIQREWRDTATRAKEIREKYEAWWVKNAQKAAVGIAKVYKGAFNKAQGVGAVWDLRSNEYATAAAQRKGLAGEYEKRAHDYMNDKEFEESKAYLLQSHQAMTQAQGFAKQAVSAHEQAKKITGSLNWYIHAEYMAATNMLAAATPPDVAVPGLPALP